MKRPDANIIGNVKLPKVVSNANGGTSNKIIVGDVNTVNTATNLNANANANTNTNINANTNTNTPSTVNNTKKANDLFRISNSK